MPHTRQCNVPALAVSFYHLLHEGSWCILESGIIEEGPREDGAGLTDTRLIAPLFREVDPPLPRLPLHPELGGRPKGGLSRGID